VIIAPHAVLTAAHCTANSDYFNIYFAKYFFAANSELTISTKNKIVHEDYSEGENDLAILFFEQDLPMGYSPVSLAKNPKDSATGQELIIAGYGVTKKHGYPVVIAMGHLTWDIAKLRFAYLISLDFIP
jgi:V8-like Glu-specific endopeptidase